MEWAQRSIQVNARSPTSWRILAASYASLNRVDEARAALEAHQATIGNSCGTCDILTSEFHAGFAKFIELNIQYFFLELMFVETGPNLLIMAYGINRLCEIQLEIDNLACDYKCYFSNATSDFWGNLAAYYVSSAVLFAIDYAKTSGYVSCSAASDEIR